MRVAPGLQRGQRCKLPHLGEACMEVNIDKDGMAKSTTRDDGV